MQTRSENRKIYILAGIICLAAFLRFFRLGHQSFWIDEILTAGSYASPPAGISYWKKLLWDVHGPLYSMIMHFWSMAGSSETWLRIPGAAAGTASVLFFYRWMKRISTGDNALAGTLILALSPFHIYYSQEMRFYSLLLMMVVLSLIFFDRFIEKPDGRRGAALGLVLGLACLSHFMALFLCAGFAV
ncbi:MAG TPA: glycosyltransferase family 39 protein [Candidatus Krumholzibacterium sp.]|nr:glycosyltransferase family 39 protein [Candidatus Krumholzibacterium sp.]